jgi:hypothetical protein
MAQHHSPFIDRAGRIDMRRAEEAARKARARAFRDMTQLLTGGGHRR